MIELRWRTASVSQGMGWPPAPANVMRACFETIHAAHVPLSSIRTLTVKPRPKPAAKQLTNTELLELVHKTNDDGGTFPAARSQGTEDQQPEEFPLRLPQSPVIHPTLITARSRYRKTKPRSSGEKTSFQTKLHKNPYAHALATPPRSCVVTGVRLPSYFQLPFGLATHPKTGAPWHLPRLAVDERPQVNEHDDVESSSSSQSSGRPPSRALSGTHILASSHILQHVNTLKVNAYRRMLPLRWKEDSSIKISQLVWREDMHILVLEILRKNVTDMLTYLVSRRAAYITPCNTAERISNHKQISAVLWLGPTRAASSSENSSGNEAIQTLSNSLQGTPVYTMHRCKSRYVPLYDLHSLLGAGHVRRMREDRPFHFGSEYAVLKEKRPTLAAQMELWKLMGYLAQDLQEDGGHEAIRVLGA